jgi:hypothetical protein
MVALLAVGLLVYFVLPLALVTNSDELSANDLNSQRNAVRTSGIQMIGGFVLVVGSYFTARTFRMNRIAQITERYTRAIDQVGEADKEEVRLGGVYALGHIAHESRDYYSTVADVLTTLIRRDTPRLHNEVPPLDDEVTLRLRKPTAQSALDVLANELSGGQRRDRRLNLTYANLRRANLGNARFSTPPDFKGCDLSRAFLDGGDFSGARFSEATLRATAVARATLFGAEIRHAELAANFAFSDLRKSHLQGSDLEQASNLETADLRGATADQDTRWPQGFDAAAAGVDIDRGPR